MKIAKSGLMEYIDWFLNQYKTFKQTYQKEITYRLVEVKEEKEGQYNLIIQVIGRATTLTASTEEILANDAWIECFSSKDIRTITYYATKALHTNKKRIVVQAFSIDTNQTLFDIKDIKTGQIIQKTATEILMDSHLLHELTPEEAHRVGYVASEESRNMEKLKLAESRARQKQIF